jgi:hypothetical protein
MLPWKWTSKRSGDLLALVPTEIGLNSNTIHVQFKSTLSHNLVRLVAEGAVLFSLHAVVWAMPTNQFRQSDVCEQAS